MKAASLAGVQPKDATAPQSPQEAVKSLFKDRLRGAEHSGRLGDINESDLLQFARDNLIIGITGEPDSSCFTIVDNGEGQASETFPETFLSLSSKLKSGLPYVQGKYNMGSSGVLRYCGQKGYKLIVSRQHSAIRPWGWTVVRERPNSPDHPIYEYFSPKGRVPTFEYGGPISPLRNKDGEADPATKANTGTIVKVYDYKIDGQRDFIGIRNGIAQNMVSTTLPFRLMDYRYIRSDRTGRARFVDERTALGLEAELTRSGSEHAERLRVREITDPLLGNIVIDAILLDRMPEALRSSTDRVFHHVNGQVQNKQKKGYLSQTIKLPGLVDNVAILIDASGLNGSAFYKVFSPDRERRMGTAENERYTEIIDDALRQSEGLKEWEQAKAAEKIDEAARKAQSDSFQRLLRQAPELQNLFGLGGPLTLRLPSSEPNIPYEGNYTPTYLCLYPDYKSRQPIELEIGERFEVPFHTDAENAYFSRSEDSGTPDVKIEPKVPRRSLSRLSRFRKRLLRNRRRSRLISPRRFRPSNVTIRSSMRLKDGRFLVGLQTLDNSARPGQKLKLVARFSDKNLPEGRLTDTVDLVLTKKREKLRRERQSKERPRLAIPHSVWTTKDGRRVGEETSEVWPPSFDDQDGGKVEVLSVDKSRYLVNFDNVSLQTAISKQQKAQREQTIAMFRNGMVLAMLSMKKKFDDHCETLEGEAQENMRNIEANIHQVNARAIALIMPFLVRTLPAYFARLQDEEN